MRNIHIKKKLATIVLIVILLVSFAATALAYIGNARTYKLHYNDCRYVHRMSEGNKVYFEDRDDAVNAGYVPCKVCRP